MPRWRRHAHCFERQLLPLRFVVVPSSDRLATAAHLHVALRRKLGRVTDTEWMASNRDYAQAMIELCRLQDDADLQALAERLYGLWGRAPLPPPQVRAMDSAEAPPALPPVTRAREALDRRYVGRLR